MRYAILFIVICILGLLGSRENELCEVRKRRNVVEITTGRLVTPEIVQNVYNIRGVDNAWKKEKYVLGTRIGEEYVIDSVIQDIKKILGCEI